MRHAIILCAAGLLVPAVAHANDIVRSAAGADAAAITQAVSDFRGDVSNGGVNNGVGGGPFSNGRREINWDAVPAAFSSPNNLPANFFNPVSPPPGSRRGALLSTPGSGFRVSANAADGPVRFDEINPAYSSIFSVFSAQKLFTALDSVVTDVRFFVPSDPTQAATVNGFGAVFTDVDSDSSTRIDYFDAADQLILSQAVPAHAGDAGLSFVGVTFDTERVARVRIFSGNAPLSAGNAELPGNGLDLVAMDDFVFGEPQAVPEPGTLALLISAGLLMRRRTHLSR